MNRKIQSSLVWVVATLFVVYSFCLNTAAAVFSDSIKETLQINDLTVSLASGAFILGFACMQIPAGYLLDRFNARFVVSCGILLLAVGNLIMSLSNNVIILSLSNFIQGLGASFSFIAAAILISQWFSKKLFPILFGFTQTISCIAAGLIHYYFTVALETFSWNEIYQGLAVFGFSLFVAALLIIQSPKGLQRGTSISFASSLGMVLKNKQALLCSVAAATSFGVLLAYASFWYISVQNFYSVDHLEAVMISGMVFLGIGVGTPLLGYLSNVYKSRMRIIHLSLVLGTMALFLGIYLPHYDVHTLLIVKIVSFFIGFFLSGSMLFYTVISEISTDKTRGVAISVLNTSVFLFNTLMLFLPYLFVTKSSAEFFTYLWILPFCIMISLSLLTFIKESYKP